MQIFNFHLMPWPHLPDDFDDQEKYPSAWVSFSNRHYDPVRGVRIYNEYLDQLEYAEELGYDGVCVNEHHQNAYGTMPSPNIVAALLARRTKRVKIAIVGNGIPLRDHPLRVAEEVAMLDVVTGGRMISGFVRGIGDEYFSLGVNPTYSLERFREAHDLIIRSWTEDGPFHHEGKHYEVRYANIWPRPLQKPHPPIWIPGFGSRETVEWCSHPDRKYAYLAVFMPEYMIKQWFDYYYECAAGYGYEPSPYQMGHLVPVYVADTDEQAEAEAAQHVSWLYNYGLRHKWEQFFPPGHFSRATMLKIIENKALLDFANLSFKELNDGGYCIVGSVDTVRERIEHSVREGRFGLLLALTHFGDMPHERTLTNMTRFAKEVMPGLKKTFAGMPEIDFAAA